MEAKRKTVNPTYKGKGKGRDGDCHRRDQLRGDLLGVTIQKTLWKTILVRASPVNKAA